MWIEVPPIKDSGIDGVLGNIEDRLPDGHPYKDTDPVTWAHEGTHGVNSRIRNVLRGTTDEMREVYYPPWDDSSQVRSGLWTIPKSSKNASYCLMSIAWTGKEPSTTLSRIAPLVPSHMRGGGYQLYLLQQQRYWNNQPLYIFDEASAYLNGTLCGLEENSPENRVQFSATRYIEFIGYAEVLQLHAGNEDTREFVDFLHNQVYRVIFHFPELVSAYDTITDFLSRELEGDSHG